MATRKGKSYRVIVAEKPSVAREIARLLGARQRKDGWIEGNGVRVTWALGHLVRYAEPDGYADRPWGRPWSFEALPMVPGTWRLEARVGDKGVVAQLDTVCKLLRGASDIVGATDAGREGELIFRLIVEAAGCGNVPMKRLWISSLTDDAISAGLADLKDAALFEPLAAAARARSQADWLVGMNLSRAYTLRHGTACPVGRVQTPTLAMVVERDRQREGFSKATYYEVRARFGDAQGKAFEAVHVVESVHDDGSMTWESRLGKAPAEAAAAQAARGAAHVSSADPQEKTSVPPQLFDLTSLQRHANARFGWPAARTLDVAQSLYEAKVLTYPRSECRHLPAGMVPTFRPTLASLAAAFDFARPALARLASGRFRPGKRFVDDARLTDHHAIVPTGRPLPGRSGAGDDGVRLYEAVARRYCAMFLPDVRRQETVAWVRTTGGVWFRAKGVRILERGWLVAEGRGGSEADEEEDAGLPALHPGEELSVSAARVEAKQTKPPAAYTDASLLAAMQNAGSRLTGAAGRELKAAGGLGTPATRAAVIEGLLHRGYLVRAGRQLVSTDKGRALVDAVEPDLRDPAMTAAWEGALRAVEDESSGTKARERAALFLGDVVAFVEAAVPRVRDAEVSSPAGVAGTEVGMCPQCGERAVVESRKGFGCAGFRDNRCDFVLWKDYMNKRLTTPQATALLAGKVVAGRQLRGKSGRAFDAGLKLKLGAYNHLELVFSDAEGKATEQGGPSRPRVRRADGRFGVGRRAAKGAAARKGLGRRRASEKGSAGVNTR